MNIDIKFEPGDVLTQKEKGCLSEMLLDPNYTVIIGEKGHFIYIGFHSESKDE